MRYALRYATRSGVDLGPYRTTVRFAPNLARERVFFDAELRDPLRFREAISALHEVVIGDLRYRKKDRSAWRAHKQRKLAEEAKIRAEVMAKAYEPAAPKAPPPPALEQDFRRLHRLYWDRRRQWARELMRDDPELFRHLVPCDPIVTVAPDVVFFECFAKDESSYGCVLADRNGFVGGQEGALGTTNVDYSLGLFDHFQALRTYRPTRLHVDPAGFEARVEGAGTHREEKIDLPSSWLRGFGQISAATGLPARRVPLSTDAVYSILATLRRRRERTGPRAIRFELTPGRPARVVIEPWELVIDSHGPAYEGPAQETIKVWGRRRLMPLARVLPLADSIEVELLGSGLPSTWVARCGELAFVLALSGWTANDWTSGGQLELLTATWQPDARSVDAITAFLREHRSASVAELVSSLKIGEGAVRSALHRICQQGQAVYDFVGSTYRYRQVVDVALGEAQLGPPPEELTKGRQIFVNGQVKLTEKKTLESGRLRLTGTASGQACQLEIDADGVTVAGRCECSHHFRFKLRKGACRHLIALRFQGLVGTSFLSSAGFGGGKFF